MEKAEITYRVVIIGGSAGSLDAVLQIVSAIPVNTKAVFVIVIHRKPDNESILQSLLSSRTKLKVREVEDKEAIVPGAVYIAPADYHLLFENENLFSLDVSEKIHHSRPSIDISFESAADIFGEHTVGILLSGANADGAEGLKKIKEAGGFTIVQNPDTADMGFMPAQAVKLNAAIEIIHAEEMADCIKKLLTQS